MRARTRDHSNSVHYRIAPTFDHRPLEVSVGLWSVCGTHETSRVTSGPAAPTYPRALSRKRSPSSEGRGQHPCCSARGPGRQTTKPGPDTWSGPGVPRLGEMVEMRT